MKAFDDLSPEGREKVRQEEYERAKTNQRIARDLYIKKRKAI